MQIPHPSFNLYDFTRDSLRAQFVRWGFSPDHAARLWNYLYLELADSFAAMPDLPPKVRHRLEAETRIGILPTTLETDSADGFTRKYLLALADGERIETVLMRFTGRVTACVSSQVGCAMGCVFCATGQMGYTRNLTAGEIVAQAVHVARALRESHSTEDRAPKAVSQPSNRGHFEPSSDSGDLVPPGIVPHPDPGGPRSRLRPAGYDAARMLWRAVALAKAAAEAETSCATRPPRKLGLGAGHSGARSSGVSRLRNVVLMGMGEPLHNYEAVMQAIDILRDSSGLALAGERITVSTVGVVPGILRLAAEKRSLHLAVSLHAATQAGRAALVPVARKWPLDELMAACRTYSTATGRRIFYEWTLIEGENDSVEHAREVGRLLQGLPAQVNLIPLNPTAGFAGAPTRSEAAKRFQKILADEFKLPSTVRQRRGIDIAAGCGQLATAG